MAKDLFRANLRARSLDSPTASRRPSSTAPQEAAEGIYAIADPSPAFETARLRKLKALVKKDTLDTYICQAYDHANLAILSMAKGKEASGSAIRDNIRKIANNDAAMKVDNALDGLKAIAEGKEIKYTGASGPCKFSDIGNIIEVAFRTAQVKDGKIVAVKI
jgi:branched-chain amino acid transport system substrate-binding protein